MGIELDEKGLNAVEKAKKEFQDIMYEINKVRLKIEELEPEKGFDLTSISKYHKLKVSENIEEKDVFVIEFKNKEKEKKIELYKLKDDELVLIGKLNENKELMLDEKYKKQWERYGHFVKEINRPYRVNFDETEKEAEIAAEDIDIYRQIDSKWNGKNKKRKEEDNKRQIEETGQEEEIANALRVPQEQILNVVEIKDERTMSNVLNKNVETKNLYAVKLRQDDGGVGSNDWVMVNKKADGSYEKAMKEDPSDTIQDLAQTLNIKNNVQETDIKEGDVSAVSKPHSGTRQAEVNRYRFSDGTTYVMETSRDYKTDVHVYEEKNGTLEPLCNDEHGKHKEETIELPDRNVDVKEEEEEEKTPWGDAESRRNRF